MDHNKDNIELQTATLDFLKNDDVNTENVSLLRQVLQFHEHRYYVLNDPFISDKEYDTLFKKLEAFEKKYPESITADSPTQRVGNDLNEDFPTVDHLVPMLSLANSYNAEDLTEWENRNKESLQTNALTYCVEPKFDGAGISLIYENDQLVRGATRGDGIQGDDITQNIKQIKSIPLSAPFSKYGIQQIEIRGEVLMYKDPFKAYNEKLMEQGLPVMANPRNAASGSLRMKKPSEVAKRNLTAVLYYISDYTLLPGAEMHPLLQSQSGCLKLIWECGLLSPHQEIEKLQGIAEVEAHIQRYESMRDTLPYEIDGMVVKIDAVALQEQLGNTSHHPRWAMAFKFKARQATSKLENVIFQVGRTGAVTPVAKITPVPIGGVMVSSVSLFNEDIIKEKDLEIGDTVLVERAADVIPYIVRSQAELRTGEEQKIIFPKNCPVCESPLVKPQGESVWRCENPDCEAQVVERIIHYCSKDAMDIRGMGESIVKKFYDEQLIHSIADIYHIDFQKIGEMDGFGKKSITNLQAAIESSKTQPLHRLIFALGIRFVGEVTAKTIARQISNLWDLKDKSEEELCQWEDIGPKVAQSIIQFFKLEHSTILLNALETAGVRFENEQKSQQNEAGNSIFSDKTFLFTGTLEQLKRSDAEALVEEKGGKILTGVSSKLNYLIVGSNAGSKLDKARKLNSVQILTEQEFVDLLNKA